MKITLNNKKSVVGRESIMNRDTAKRNIKQPSRYKE